MRVLSVCWPYALTNALATALIGALAYGGWAIFAVLALSILMGGAIDEVVGDQQQRLDHRCRLFCDINLYATLPLLMIITYLLLYRIGAVTNAEIAAGSQSETWSAHAPAPFISIVAVGYFYGLAGVTVAHELTHRGSSALALLWARLLLAFTLNPTFETYHVHGHHRNIGTYRDPATARRGEYVLAFVVRTLISQSVEGWHLEADRLGRKGSGVWSWRNRVLSGIFCSTALLLAAAMTAGTRGFVAVLIAAIWGRLLNEMVNYVQHYGIVRVEGAPIQMRHSWDSCRFLSNALQYNLPHHADHHMFASKQFWQLGSFAQTPKLPHGYHIMSFIAVHQPSWRKVINPLLADWDRTLASDMERSLVRERGWTIEGRICEHATERRPTARCLSNQSSSETGVPPP